MQEGGAGGLLASVLTTWGIFSIRYKINIEGHIFIFSESNTRIHTKSPAACPPNPEPGCFWLFPQVGTRLLGPGLLQEGESEGGGPVRPRGKFVLQWSPPGVERVADIVVQEAAQRRHIDVSKP